ncbi:nucleotide sugar dehydrogenase [Pedobacter panaciterrae]
MKLAISDAKIAIIGLGYVGLPLAIEFGKKYKVLGFDVKEERVRELTKGNDKTREADLDELKKVTLDLAKNKVGLGFSFKEESLLESNVFVVTVPTPINQFKCPDLVPLLKASVMIGKALKYGDIVIYESTVYPGCTEEECVPVLERSSGLVFNKDFFVGYSPERISPGDKVHTLTTIKKVTSGSTPEIAQYVDELYSSIITAGTYKAPSIKVAEASKAIENAQRDINISFINELALIFDRMGIDTNDVIDAASTKWNFLKYQPGLVGGHCIGVDPYYLAHKAEALGYHPQVILSGRRVNDHIGAFIAEKVIKLMIKKDHKIKGSKALILGITFKENCPDVRNTRVVDIYKELVQFGLEVDVYDPWANSDEVKSEYGISILNELTTDTTYDAVVVAVAHKEFLELDYSTIKRNNGIIFDTKACLERSLVDGRL